MKYLSNAFSLQMIKELDVCDIHIEKISPEEIETTAELISVIGHADCARICSNILNANIPVNRTSNTLNKGDIMYVAQFIGGRLPEGATELPPGVSLQFFKVEVW